MESPGETVLVTGSSGLIDAVAVRRFASRFQIVGFDRDGNPSPPIEAELRRD